MNKQLSARILLVLALSVVLILQPAHMTGAQAADPVTRRVVASGETYPACGGGWDITDLDPALRPCTLQTALALSAPGDEIWVAQGNYVPSWRYNPDDPRSATFQLPNGVAVYGGFAGNETAREQRIWKRYRSLLSGDLDGNDLDFPANDASDILGANAYHVVTLSAASSETVLDGFTIAGGDASGQPGVACGPACGGGIYIDNGSPTLANLSITGSRAAQYGGGLYSRGWGSPVLSGVHIRGGQAYEGGGAYIASNGAVLEDMVIELNQAVNGAGLFIDGAAVRINSPLFGVNEAAGDPASEGGALLLHNGAFASLLNTTFHGNTAILGTVASLRSGSNLFLTHVTAVQNFASISLNGGVIHTSGNDSFSIYDSIFTENGLNTFSGSGFSQGLIANTIIEECPASASCTDLFPPNTISLWSWWFVPLGNTGGYPLLAGSPLADRAACLDRSTPEPTPITRDQRGAARPYGAACDLGALEYSPRVVYVDHDAAGDNSGTSWTNAMPDLALALYLSAPGDQLWVAAGTYYPTDIPTDRSASFVLRPDVEMYGGFAGDETSFDQRDFRANETILSGDIDHDQPIPTGNSYHVVFSDDKRENRPGMRVLDSTVLDGFTITGGVADGPLVSGYIPVNRQGGGIYLLWSAPTLRNLVIRGNFADHGGGMYNDSWTFVSNVLFQDNEAICGGGLANGAGASPDFQGQAILTNVTFTGNTANYGGAICNLSADSLYDPPYVTQPGMMHVTIFGNSADFGGAIFTDTPEAPVFGGAMAGSIIWNNGPDPLYVPGDGPGYRIQNSIVEGGCPAGEECINVSSEDPQLGALGAAAGGPLTFPLLPGSPAIDANPADECTYVIFTGTFTNERLPLTYDQRGAPRPLGSACDLGAHEYQAGLSILSGDEQRTDAFTDFPEPLVVAVTSDWGDVVEGMQIHFTTHVSDAGGQISSSSAVVLGGQASVTAAAQNAPAFTVEASAPHLESVYFQLRVNDSTVILSADPNPAVIGQPVALSAQVLGRYFGLYPPPAGAITFKDGETILGTVELPALAMDDPPLPARLTVSNLALGTHSLTATYSGDAIYHDVTTSPTLDMTIIAASAEVDLNGLAQPYTGSPHAVTVTTTPPGLAVTVTYEGSLTPPTAAGSYAVLAVVTDPNYPGSASGILEISKAGLKVQAGSTEREFGAANPEIPILIEGLVNGEDASVLWASQESLTGRQKSPPRYNGCRQTNQNRGGQDGVYHAVTVARDQRQRDRVHLRQSV